MLRWGVKMTEAVLPDQDFNTMSIITTDLNTQQEKLMKVTKKNSK